MFLAWIVFPLVLAALSLGCGLLVEQLAGLRLPGALLLPVGLATIIVVAGLATANSATAKLAAPAVVALAVAGLALTAPWPGRRLDRGALVAGVAVFAVYAAPIVLSGKPTFAGYITLDDTSTWLAMTDRVMEHGRSLAGLAPSSYEAALDSYLSESGYPVGAFLPLGVGGKLVGQDIAWLFQPYIAFAAAMLGLALYTLVRRLVRSQWLCAIAAFVAAQPALLYAYAMWSGIKEVTAAALVALFAALLPSVFSRRGLEERSPRNVLALATVVAAVLGALSVGGLAWLFAAFVLAFVAAARTNPRALARKSVALTVAVAVLSIPAIAIAAAFIRHETSTESLTAAVELGNLVHPLSRLQIFGIWPAGDFRFTPDEIDATHVLIALVAGAAALGLVVAWRRRVWELLVYVGTVAIGAVLLMYQGSPWIDGKAMATASAAFLLAAMAACGFVFERGRRVEAAVAAAAIAGGVLWSNALAYQGVWLAPQAQLAELASIGRQFAGSGPTLMTEYQPHGVRHFLRDMDPEGAGELRRRVIPLLNGQGVAKGGYANLDEFQPDAILVYKTLVLRRSPTESRPSSIYRLVREGRYYDVWQRPDTYAPILRHLPLGAGVEPGAIPQCSELTQLAGVAGPSGRLAAARRAPNIVVDFRSVPHPPGWTSDPAGNLYPTKGHGTVETDVTVPAAGSYSFWLGGSFRDRLRLYVDGKLVADARHRLDSLGYAPLGSAALRAGSHHIAISYGGSDLHPGSGGFQFAFGPLVLGRDPDDPPVEVVPSADARALCGQNLDWVEALGS